MRRNKAGAMRLNDDDQVTKFSASTVHLEHITTALNCLTPFGTKDDVLIFIDADGLSFVRENNHVIRIQLLLSRELFMSYLYRSEVIEDEEGANHMKLCVKINHILDSVNVTNRNLDDVVECTISYDGHGSPFVFIFEDSMILERVEYSTYVIKDMDNTGLTLDKDHVIFECIMKGDVLYKALKELKEIDCKECYVYVKTSSDGDEDVFAFISKSELGFSKIRLPSNKSIIEKLQVYENDSTTICHDVPAIGFFDFASFDKIRMSTKIASKVLFRMDVHGLLSVNILSQTDDIVITDKTVATKSFDTTNKRLQLPKDYPGIVIEVCMIEKEALDDYSQREIELLMQTNELGETVRNVKGKSKKRVNPNYNDRNDVNNNLLQMENHKKIRIPESNNIQEEKDDQDNHEEEDQSNNSTYPYGTNDLPLFF